MASSRASAGGWGIVAGVRALAGLARGVGPAWLTVLASLGLSLIGIHAIDVADALKGSEGVLGVAALKQAASLGVGVAGAVLIALPHYRVLGVASWVLLGVSLVMMVFLLVPGVPTSIVRARNGARSWIDLGPIDLQPSELAKIAYVLALAWYLRYRDNHRTVVGLLPPALITGLPVALIMLQPDLGTASLFIPALFAVLVAAGAKLKHLAVIVLIAAMAAPASYPFLKPHQQQRIKGLLLQIRGDTSADQDINMQSVTAQRLAGAGMAAGLPEERARLLLHYNPLPERHNDMVFAVICNRLGWAGGVLTLGLYGVWIVGALLTSATCREPFGRLVPVGLTGFIVAQVFVNVGMNLGIVPIIGITLPFVSLGGSSLVTVWLMTGLIASVALRRPRLGQRHSFEFDRDD